jgi:hypothetical protein
MGESAAALLKFLPNVINLANSLVSATTEAKRNADLIEFQKALIGLQSLIASVQQENATLLGLKHDAEAALERMKDWETEKERYMLAQPFPGCMVYALQEEMSDGEMAHYLCTACFDNGKRSLLQGRENRGKSGVPAYSSYLCPNPACKAEAFTKVMNVPPPKYWDETL